MKSRRSLLLFLTLIGILPLVQLSAQTSSTGPGVENPEAIRRFGLFVGANNGGTGRERLLWAVSDAQRMSQVMTEIGGMDQTDQKLLTDPKINDINNALTRVKNLVNQAHGDSRRVEFMFYYSGHSDETGLLLGDERLDYAKLRAAITDVKADVSIAVLDSCASGAFTRQKGGTRVQPFLLDSSNDVKGYAYLTSASADEAAQESDRLGSSFFTHFIISGLRGAADASGDGRVTLNEAYQYAFNETLARTESTVSGPQHPSIDIQLKGYGDLVLSDLSQPNASIALAPDIDGRVSVRDAKGVLTMEISKQAGKAMTLALQPGTYSVRVETQTGVFGTAAKISRSQQVKISQADLQRAQLASNRTRGGTGTDTSSGSAGSDTGTVAATDGATENTGTAGTGGTGDASNGTVGGSTKDYKKRAIDLVRNGGNSSSDTGTSASDGKDTGSADSAVPGSGDTSAQWISIGVDVHVDLDALGKQIDAKIQEALNTAPEGVAPWIYEEKPQSPEKPANKSREIMPFHVSFVPGLGNVADAWKTQSFITLSPVIGFVDLNTGVMLSTLMNIAGTAEHGAQAAFIMNIAPELDGAQISFIGNIAPKAIGVQAAGIFAVADESLAGAQLSSVFNIAGGTMWGVQVAPVFNIAGDEGKGVQIGGVFNYAKDMMGIQVAGVFNAADTMKGVQIGFINIAKDMEGLPIGLINIISNGIHDIAYWNSIDDRHWVGFYNGSKDFYGKFFAGMYENINFQDVAGLTLGFSVGWRPQLGPFYLDVEAGAQRPTRGSTGDQRAQSIVGQGIDESVIGIGVVPMGRLAFGISFGSFKSFIGIDADLFVPGAISPGEYYRDWDSGKITFSTIHGSGGDSVLAYRFVVGGAFSF